MGTSINKTLRESIGGVFGSLQADITAGLLVFLLALPLSLGIAKASGFPPAMGVLTAIIGGLATSFFRGGELTIKGPAAGLITVCAAAVTEFGGGEIGWHATVAVIVVMAVLQVLIAYAGYGSLSDFFPHSAVHGMLAAIGLIIIAKQIPVLLGDDPSLYKGEGPIELFLDIPKFVLHAHWHIAAVGLLGLVILFALPYSPIKWLRKVPAPMIVLLMTVPLAMFWHFKETEPAYSLVSIGNFWQSIRINADFSHIGTFAFWKYVVMFLFVSSLESLLTVKAIDNLDPQKRVTNPNNDLRAQGVGNAIAGLLGGLPMISEVVRSSANVGFAAKSRGANFFHGIFLLIAMLLFIPFIEMIPNSALAAMLMYAGFRLAAPKEFLHMYAIGKEQLVIFLVTIIVTLLEDLLLGVAAGILVKIIFHLANGAKFKMLFSARYDIEQKQETVIIHVFDCAVFTNILRYKPLLTELADGREIILSFNQTKLIDHSFMSFAEGFAQRYREGGGRFRIMGLENHRALSAHPLSTRVLAVQ